MCLEQYTRHFQTSLSRCWCIEFFYIQQKLIVHMCYRLFTSPGCQMRVIISTSINKDCNSCTIMLTVKVFKLNTGLQWAVKRQLHSAKASSNWLEKAEELIFVKLILAYISILFLEIQWDYGHWKPGDSLFLANHRFVWKQDQKPIRPS